MKVVSLISFLSLPGVKHDKTWLTQYYNYVHGIVSRFSWWMVTIFRVAKYDQPFFQTIAAWEGKVKK
jgi:hypothetical protein